jgi:hypothetical protein
VAEWVERAGAPPAQAIAVLVGEPVASAGRLVIDTAHLVPVVVERGRGVRDNVPFPLHDLPHATSALLAAYVSVRVHLVEPADASRLSSASG